MQYESVIGLEVHIQLATKSKIFCSCSTEFGALPNTHICPVCTGQPGTLPALNKQVVEYALRAAAAINCSIAGYTKFDRKNYFYPDLPKAYQISQFDLPIGENGFIFVTDVNNHRKKINVTRIHLEEDAGKLIHSSDDFTKAQYSFVDYNRGGVPLLEIVSEPELSNSKEAYQYLTKLKSIMRYIKVSECNMEQGSLRCDANVSIRPAGSEELGTKTEVKNMNSFKYVMKALDYEIARQKKILEEGGKIKQETRLWDVNLGRTYPMRSKEESHDYRYFPEPDLVSIQIDSDWVSSIALPELPDTKRERLIKQYGISEYDAAVLTAEWQTADYFEILAKAIRDAKMASNWIMGEVSRRLKERQIDIRFFNITPMQLAELLIYVKNGKISNNIAKNVFEKMIKQNESARNIIEKEGLIQITDDTALQKIITEIIARHPSELAAYKEGKTKVLGFFMGQLMNATHGKANPKIASQLLKTKLDE